MTLDLLWTDKCFLFLLALGAVFFALSLTKRPVRDSFALMLRRPIAVSAGIVLLFFLTIGVLDSIHFNTQRGEAQAVESILDKLLYPVGTFYEKTYSAPLALHAYTSETQIQQGIAHLVYPRLHYVPKTIKTLADKDLIIHKALSLSFFWSALISISLYLFFLLIKQACHKPKAYRITSSELSALITLAVMVFFILCAYILSRSFHVFGTGQIGQDIFYFTLKSVRTGLIIGLLTTLFMLPLALFLGIASGYFGGVVDDIIQYVYTTLSSIPGVLLITASVLSMQTYIASHPQKFSTLAQSADARLFALCFILGITSWTSLCRLLRAEVLKLREVDFVLAAKAQGSGWFRIISKHLLPNVMHIVVITLVLDFSYLVMAEAVLSYVGVGVSPMTMSWGNMINGARLELARDPIVWWPIGAAFLLMFLLVLAMNLFADALRDAFDPRGGWGV